MKKYVGKLGLLILVLALLFWPVSNAQSAHSINLTWGASSTTGVLYIVSRGTVSGGPYTVLSSTVSGLTYNDIAGVGGTTYYYVVQATCTGGTCPTGVSGNSANSNQASATFLSGPAAPAGLGAVAQ